MSKAKGSYIHSLALPVQVVVSGDTRLSANQACWPVQAEMERALNAAFEEAGLSCERAHPYNRREKHGFISSQREGMDAFAKMDRRSPVVVPVSVWQYSHHVLPGLIGHEGPILTIGNWSGTWPGLVGLLNLNACLSKAGVDYSTLWSSDLRDTQFKNGFAKWLETGKIRHRTNHVVALAKADIPERARVLGEELAGEIRARKAILGVFDEGCMGMYNAIIPDELLFPAGIYKERLSQSALYYEVTQTTDREAFGVFSWFGKKGFKFNFGEDPETDLTKEQVLQQCKMYIAAVRMGGQFGCDAIGIQYQQGLKDLLPASDLAEAILNNSVRPPVKNRQGFVINPGRAYPHFNEADECAGVDALMTQRVHEALQQPTENTLHDLRWGDMDASGKVKDFVWVFMISGGAPPAHHSGEFRGSVGERQPPMYFRLGGATCKGVAKPGEIVWSRIFVEKGKLKMDLGRAKVVALHQEETERRWQQTTPQWPIMHAVTYGVTRDEMMARHKSNHVQVAYAKDAKAADLCLYTKAVMAEQMGMEVSLCGTRADGSPF